MGARSKKNGRNTWQPRPNIVSLQYKQKLTATTRRFPPKASTNYSPEADVLPLTKQRFIARKTMFYGTHRKEHTHYFLIFNF